MTRGETIREDYRPSQASAKVRFTLTGDGDLFPEMLESSEEEDAEIRDAKSITKKGLILMITTRHRLVILENKF